MINSLTEVLDLQPGPFQADELWKGHHAALSPGRLTSGFNANATFSKAPISFFSFKRRDSFLLLAAMKSDFSYIVQAKGVKSEFSLAAQT